MDTHIIDNPFPVFNHVPRPRVNDILMQAAACNLVYIIASAGYGKTQAVRHYVNQHSNAMCWWVQLTESDNIASRYWEHLTHSISNPERAAQLREFGFPETLTRFKQFVEILENTDSDIFLVFDDFHLINSEQMLVFVKRCASLKIPGMCTIILSRKEPEARFNSLLGKAAVITEDELRYTEDELSVFFNHQNISVPSTNIPQIINVTKGWALAIQMLSQVLKRMPRNINFALDIMKQNIYKLMEAEAFDGLGESVKKTMVQYALISDLPFESLGKTPDADPFIESTNQLAPFMWYDSLIGDYRVHPLYLEFLQSKQDILSPEEKQEIYCRAAKWCNENSYYLDAMKYYAKSSQFRHMLETILTYPFRLPHDTCEYLLGILEEINPAGEPNEVMAALLLKNVFTPLMLMGMGRYAEAETRCFDIIKEWEQSDMPIAANILYVSYSNLTYLDMFLCTATHEYNAPKYLKKSREYFKQLSIPPAKVNGPFIVADIRSFACLVGEGASLEEFDHFIEAAKQTALLVEETSHYMYRGYDDLVACEIAFYKNQLGAAKIHAHRAINQASEKKQYSIVVMAIQYLLRAALHDGDYLLARVLLKQLHNYLVIPDFWNRQLLYDLTMGRFYSQIGLPEMSPSWLTLDDRGDDIHMPAGELLVSLNNCIASQKYNQALTILHTVRKPQERFLFGEILFSLYGAVAKLNTGNIHEGLDDFRRAYALSFNGIFEMPFVELGKHVRPLVSAALGCTDCGIPMGWLIMIDRKASIYAKKAASVLNAYKQEKNIVDYAHLTKRETEILSCVYQGLSQKEIAEYLVISVNTVKKALQSIYEKLGANNNIDAIRMAIEKKLL